MSDADKSGMQVLAAALSIVIAFLALAAGLFLAVEQIDDAKVYCKDQAFIPPEGGSNAVYGACAYPTARIKLEQGVSHMIAVCRCQ